MLLLSHFSNRGASSSKKPAFEMPQDKNPRRFASDFIKWVWFSIGFIGHAERSRNANLIVADIYGEKRFYIQKKLEVYQNLF